MGSFVIRYWDKKFFIFHASWATRNHILTWVLTWVAIELLVKWRDLKIHKQLWRINRIILYTLRFENIYFFVFGNTFWNHFDGIKNLKSWIFVSKLKITLLKHINNQYQYNTLYWNSQGFKGGKSILLWKMKCFC